MAASGRTLVVGDVHGCARELDDLLGATSFRPGHDRLVLVGDLVARGPDSRGVVARVRELGAVAVRGNHDEKVLAWWRVRCAAGLRAADRMVPLSTRHRDVVESLREDDFAALEATPLTLALPEHGAVVVHAGVDPTRGLAGTDAETLITVRSVRADGRVTRTLDGAPWASRWRGPLHVVFGHDARRGLQLEPFATGLDTGCCYGRALTALVLDAGQAVPGDPTARRAALVSVPARGGVAMDDEG